MKKDHFKGLFHSQAIDSNHVTSVTSPKQLGRDRINTYKVNKNNDVENLSRLSRLSRPKNSSTCMQAGGVSVDTNKSVSRDNLQQVIDIPVVGEYEPVQEHKKLLDNDLMRGEVDSGSKEQPSDYGMVTCWQCRYWMNTWCSNHDAGVGSGDPDRWRRCKGFCE